MGFRFSISSHDGQLAVAVNSGTGGLRFVNEMRTIVPAESFSKIKILHANNILMQDRESRICLLYTSDAADE